jgi:hypothetical protein
MTCSRLALLSTVACALACGGSSSSTDSTFHVVPGDNVLPVSVNGAHCVLAADLNTPCVSVEVCVPGTSTCQTISSVLLDTGSVGLRVFKQSLTLSLPPVTLGGSALAECVQFADGTADWGPVETADVVLASEPAVRMPIQVIDATFGAVPSTCGTPEKAPSTVDGILGVGAFVEDCGASCAADAANGLYYTWNGSKAAGAAVPVSSQLQNPVALLPVDNNGLIVALPGVPDAGAPSLEGSVVLGIGTRSNNAPAKATSFPLDAAGEFTTTVSGGAATPGSFADTGSNGLFFPPPSPIPSCADAPDWFCPPSTMSFSATNAPSAGLSGPSAGVTFQIANFDALVVKSTNGNAVFSHVGGAALPKAGFDWGLPFFLGRTVYLGLEGRTSTLGPGPSLGY